MTWSSCAVIPRLRSLPGWQQLFASVTEHLDGKCYSFVADNFQAGSTDDRRMVSIAKPRGADFNCFSNQPMRGSTLPSVGCNHRSACWDVSVFFIISS